MRRLSLMFGLLLVGTVRWLVPRRARARWTAEWRAELAHLSCRADRPLFSHSLSSIPHAAALARQEWSFDALLGDLRYAVRRLRTNPGFVLVAVLTIGIGVGANTAIFSVVNSTLLNPLPFKDADRLVFLWRDAGSGMQVTPRAEDIAVWRDQVQSFEELHAYGSEQLTLSGRDEPEELIALRVMPNLFSFLGVEPALGRAFSQEEADSEERLVIVSYSFWRGRLGGRDDVIGTDLILDGEAHEVIGVLPRGFVFQAPFSDPPLWVPLSDGALAQHRSPFALARLLPGVSVEAANAELDAVAANQQADPEMAEYPGRARRPRDMVGDQFVTSMMVLQAAVAFVLLIACANVANLLLARGTAQQREMAVRAAIGAGRGRLLRQLLTENLLLALGGGVVGYGLAHGGVALLRALRPERMTNLETVRVDPSMLLFAFGVAALTGIIFGLVPALQSSRPDVLEQLKDGTRSGTPGSSRVWLRNTLIVTEVSFSIVLLVGAGLLLNSLGHLVGTDLGFDPDNVLTMSVFLPEESYPDEINRQQFRNSLKERIELVAGDRLDSISFASNSPPRMGIWFGTFTAEGREPIAEFDNTVLYSASVAPGFFRTMRIPLLHGRDFKAADAADEDNPMIINAGWARAMWGDEDAVGERFFAGDGEDATYFTVVGVVADAKLGGASHAMNLQAFRPGTLSGLSLALVIRTKTDPLPLVNEFKQQVWALDDSLPVKEVGLLERRIAATLAPQRFNATLMTLSAVVALSLALIGLYGVLSYSVGQRTREIGIRLALGAHRANVVPMVAWQGMRLVFAGIGIGTLAALGLARFLESLLYGVTPQDTVTYVAVAGVLTLVATLACLIPAVRAARLDPMVALRSE